MADEPKNTEMPQDEAKKDEAKFTREDLAKLVGEQVAQKTAKQDAEWQKKLDEAVKKARQDAIDEAKMSAEELAVKKAKDREDEMKAREAALDKRFAELERRERLDSTKSKLAELKLPTNAAEWVMGDDDASTDANIKAYQESFNQAVRDAVHRESAQSEPSNGGQYKAPQKKLSEMTLEEQTQLYMNNQQLYQQLLSQE